MYLGSLENENQKVPSQKGDCPSSSTKTFRSIFFSGLRCSQQYFSNIFINFSVLFFRFWQTFGWRRSCFKEWTFLVFAFWRLKEYLTKIKKYIYKYFSASSCFIFWRTVSVGKDWCGSFPFIGRSFLIFVFQNTKVHLARI